MAMERQAIAVDLVRTARIVLNTVARNIGSNGSGVYSALLASQLYEMIKAELARTPRNAGAVVGVLSAALDQCRNAAVHVDDPALLEGKLRAAVEILEAGPPDRADAGARPRFTVIEGGRAAAARR
jgi:hypothetical protein